MPDFACSGTWSTSAPGSRRPSIQLNRVSGSDPAMSTRSSGAIRKERDDAHDHCLQRPLIGRLLRRPREVIVLELDRSSTATTQTGCAPPARCCWDVPPTTGSRAYGRPSPTIPIPSSRPSSGKSRGSTGDRQRHRFGPPDRRTDRTVAAQHPHHPPRVSCGRQRSLKLVKNIFEGVEQLA
jgi:hypothetical protein